MALNKSGSIIVDDLRVNNLSNYKNLWGENQPRQMIWNSTYRYYAPERYGDAAFAEYYLPAEITDGAIRALVQFPPVDTTGRSTSIYLSCNNKINQNTNKAEQLLRAEVKYMGSAGLQFNLLFWSSEPVDDGDPLTLDHALNDSLMEAGKSVKSYTIPIILNPNYKYWIEYQNIGNFHNFRIWRYGSSKPQGWDVIANLDDSAAGQEHTISSMGAFYFALKGESTQVSPRLYRVEFEAIAGEVILPGGASTQLPTIDRFAPDTDILMNGSTTTLRWETSYADTVKVNGTEVARDGQMNINPSVDSNYIIEAKNTYGTVSRQTMIRVVQSTSEFPTSHTGGTTTPVDTGTPTPDEGSSTPIEVGTPSDTDSAIMIDVTKGSAWWQSSPSPASPYVLGSCRNHVADHWTRTEYGGPAVESFITARANELITNWGSDKWGRNTYWMRHGHTPTNGKAWDINSEQDMVGYHFERHWNKKGVYPYDDIREHLRECQKWGGMTPSYVVNYGSGGGYLQSWENDFSIPPDFLETGINAAASAAADEAARMVGYLVNPQHPFRATYPMDPGLPVPKFFEIGNEMNGNWERGHNRASTVKKYAVNATEFAKRMRAAAGETPIQIGFSSSGAANWTGPNDWGTGPAYIADKFLEAGGAHFDAFIIHPYNNWPVGGTRDNVDGWLGHMFWQQQVWRGRIWPIIEKWMNVYTNRTDPWTLWNTESFWLGHAYEVPADKHYQMAGVVFYADAIATAINNDWPLSNIFCFFHGKQEIGDNQFFRSGTTTLGPFKLHKKLSKTWGDWNVRCNTQNIKTFPITISVSGYDPNCPALTASASTSSDGRWLYVLIVNRRDDAHAVKLNIRGFQPKAVMYEHLYKTAKLTDPAQATDFVTNQIDISATNYTYSVKGASVTILQLENNGTIVVGDGSSAPPPSSGSGGDVGTLPSFGGKYEPPTGVTYFGASATMPVEPLSDTTSNVGFSQYNEDLDSWKLDRNKWQAMTGKFPMLFNNYLPWQEGFNDSGRLVKILAKYLLTNVYPMISLNNLDKYGQNGAVLFPISDLVVGTSRDTEIRQIARTLRDVGKPIFFAPFYAPNDPKNAWCPFNADGSPRAWTVDDFKAAWRKIKTIFTEEGANNVAFVLTMAMETQDNFNHANYYPGHDYVDWISWEVPVDPDAFSVSPFGVPWPDFKATFVACVDSVVYGTKPIMFSKVTFRRDTNGTGPTYQQRITEFFDHIKTRPRVKAFIHHNNDDLDTTTGNRIPYRLTNDSTPITLLAQIGGNARYKESYGTTNTTSPDGLSNALVKFALSSGSVSQITNKEALLLVYTSAYAALAQMSGVNVGKAQPFIFKEEAGPAGVAAKYNYASASAAGYVTVNSLEVQKIIADAKKHPANVHLLREMGRGALEFQRYDYNQNTLVWSKAAEDGLSLALIVAALLQSGNAPVMWDGVEYRTTLDLRSGLLSSGISKYAVGGRGKNSEDTAATGDNSTDHEIVAAAIIDIAGLVGWNSLANTFKHYRDNKVTEGFASWTSKQKMEDFFIIWSTKAGKNILPRLQAWGWEFSQAVLDDAALVGLAHLPPELPRIPDASGHYPGSPATGYAVQGQARELGTARPIAGMTIIIGNKTIRTDADGNYFLTGFQPGTYEVLASKSGYQIDPFRSSVTISDGDVTFNFVGLFDGSALPTITGLSPSTASPGDFVVIEGQNFDTDPANIEVRLESNLQEGQTIQAFVMEATESKVKIRIPEFVKSGRVILLVKSRVSPSAPILTIVEIVKILDTKSYRPRLTSVLRPMTTTGVIQVGAPFCVKPYLEVPSVPPYTHSIDWGDGEISTEPIPVVPEGQSGNKELDVYQHTFQRPGTYLVQLTTTDGLNPAQIAVDVLEVTVVDEDTYQILGLFDKLPRWLGNYY